MAIQRSVLNGQMTKERAFEPERPGARVLTVTSGKGGVGKTNIAANLGIALARQGKKVCILDADLGLANINILLGIYPEFTVEDLFTSNRDIEELVTHGPGGIDIIPGASSLGKISEFTEERRTVFVQAVERLERLYDYILIDTSAGISETVLSFVASANESIVVVSPEPTSLTDAYSLLKVLKGKGVKREVFTLVNMVLSYEDSVKIFNRFNSTTKKFLDIEMKYLGYVMTDQVMVASVIQQKPVMVLSPESIPGHCFTSIAGKFDTRFKSFEKRKFSDNWKEISGFRETTVSAAEDNPPFRSREETLSTPEKVKRGYERSVQEREPLKEIVRMIESGELDEKRAGEYLHSIEQSCIRMFHRSPVDIKTSIYNSLDLAGFSESRLRELALMLETIYVKRSQKQLFDLEDILMRLIEEGSGSEESLKKVIGNLRDRFRKSFNKTDVTPEEFFSGYFSSGDLTKKDFETFITLMKSAYLKKFGNTFHFMPEGLHKEILETVRGIRERDSAIGSLLQQVVEYNQGRSSLGKTLNGKLSQLDD